MQIDDAVDDGARLSALLGSRNRALFAREHKIPGGASMISQHVSGHRPISFKQAVRYAEALKVPLAEISPRLATLASRAASPHRPDRHPTPLEAALPVVLQALATLPLGRWRMVRARLDDLPEQPQAIDSVLADVGLLLGLAPVFSDKRRTGT